MMIGFNLALNAQKVELHIVDKSISVRNDTLYFKYIITNNSTSHLCFYNLGCSGIDASGIKRIFALKGAMPRVLVDIFDEKGKLPQKIRNENVGCLSLNIRPTWDIYYLIKPRESKEVNAALGLWPMYPHKGKYKLQIHYFSNSYYKEDYAKSMMRDSALKYSKLFYGVLSSNFCEFYYPGNQ